MGALDRNRFRDVERQRDAAYVDSAARRLQQQPDDALRQFARTSPSVKIDSGNASRSELEAAIKAPLACDLYARSAFEAAFPPASASALGHVLGRALKQQVPAAADAARTTAMPPELNGITTSSVKETTVMITQSHVDAARREGAAAERKRIAAILESEEGKKRPSAAMAAAFDTDMAPGAVSKFLARLPEESASSGKSQFELAMERGGNPDLGAPGDGEHTRSRAQAAADSAFGPGNSKRVARSSMLSFPSP